MKKLNLILLLLGIALFAGCSGDAVEDLGINEDTLKAKLTISVRDAVTGLPIDDAKVTLVSANQPALTKGGLASFENVRIGAHKVQIEKDDYAAIFGELEIERNKVKNTDGSIFFTASMKSIDVTLNPANAELYGYIFYTNTKGQTLPAVGTKVYVDLGSHFVQNIKSADVDANGSRHQRVQRPQSPGLRRLVTQNKTSPLIWTGLCF